MISTRTKYIITVLFFCLLLGISLYFILIPNTHEKLQKALNQYRINNHITAMSMSVSYPGKNKMIHDTVYSGTLAINSNKPINKNNLFQMGSITKSFTSATLLRLSANPKYHLTLQQTVGHWLPQYKKWNNITIQELLNHTSGIYNYTNSFLKGSINLKANKPWTLSQLVAIAYNKPLYFKPGTHWHYSNTNYAIAAMIIEKASGKTISYEINQTIKLAGLHNTYYNPSCYPCNLLPRMVHGYNAAHQDVTANNLSWAGPAGAIISNTKNINQWISELLIPGKILPAKQLKEMQALVLQSSGQATTYYSKPTYGLGIMRYHNIWWHDGSTAGYSAIMMHNVKHNITVDIASDTGNVKITDDFHPLAAKIAEILNVPVKTFQVQ